MAGLVLNAVLIPSSVHSTTGLAFISHNSVNDKFSGLCHIGGLTSEVGRAELMPCYLASMCCHVSFPCAVLQIQEFLRLAQRGIEEKERERALVSLRRGLQHPETQQIFIRSVWMM